MASNESAHLGMSKKDRALRVSSAIARFRVDRLVSLFGALAVRDQIREVIVFSALEMLAVVAQSPCDATRVPLPAQVYLHAFQRTRLGPAGMQAETGGIAPSPHPLKVIESN